MADPPNSKPNDAGPTGKQTESTSSDGNATDALHGASFLNSPIPANRFGSSYDQRTTDETDFDSAATPRKLIDAAQPVKVNPPNASVERTVAPAVTDGRNIAPGEKTPDGKTKVNPSAVSDAGTVPVKAPVQDTAPVSRTTSTQGEVQNRVIPPTGAQIAAPVEQAPVKQAPGEVRSNDTGRPVTDTAGSVKTAPSTNLEPAPLPIKTVPANPIERPESAGVVPPERKIDTPNVSPNVAAAKIETAPNTVPGSRALVDGTAVNVSNPAVKPDAKTNAGDNIPIVSTNQFKPEPAGILPGRADQSKVEAMKGEAFKLDPKSDIISTQGVPGATNRQDTARGLDTKAEPVRPVEQGGLKDSATFKDPKTAGVLNETFGQKPESGSRVEPSSHITGNRQDAITAGQKADQITKGIEGRVNEGAKKPGVTDGTASGGRQPGIEGGGKPQGITDSAQPGVKQGGAIDGATTSSKQPSVTDGSSSTVRQPLHETGEKAPSAGGGSSAAADSNKRSDAGMGTGGKTDGQPASGGMGGGSSAPVDRAPHSPFKVEDAQPTKGNDAAGVKGGPAGTPGTGPRFDTGEVRGTEPGARFDSGELKDGRSTGTQTGGLKGGDSTTVKGTDAGIGKGSDAMGTKGAGSGGQGIGGSSGSSDGGILGDKRQPSMLPDGLVNQGGKPSKVGDGISGGGGILGTDVPFVLPGALSGKEGGRRQSDQIFTDKGKAEAAAVGKQDAVAPAGRSNFSGQGGKADRTGPAGKGEAAASGKSELAGVAGKSDLPPNLKDKGQKADIGIPAAMAGQIGASAAEVGGVLKNFAQSVLSDGKSSGQVADSTLISKELKGAFKSPAALDGSSKDVPVARQDFAGPGKITQILPGDLAPGVRSVGTGGVPIDAGAKRTEFGSSGAVPFGSAADSLAGGDGSNDGESVPLEEFSLPEVDLLGEANEIEEVKEIEESAEENIEDEMHYELALGLQLYTSIAEAQYGAYYYCTKEGDTVESVAREIVGDARCSPLVFSLNKDHIVASTEYGVHPFKVGVMIQLPTPRDLKEFFSSQT